MSEMIMNEYGVGQDEFIFRMYSIALLAISAAAAVKGDLMEGIAWMLQPGTYAEQQTNVPIEHRAWSASGKLATMILFSSMGFFGSSCSAAITKNFGALTMSITSTARKATTLFLSFLLFDNECTFEHILGIVVFISALTAKSFRRKGKRRRGERSKRRKSPVAKDIEIAIAGPEPQEFPPPSKSFDSTDKKKNRQKKNEQQATNVHSLSHPSGRYHIV
jgi:hypothetical protein